MHFSLFAVKVFSAELKIAFSIDTSGDDARIQPERFCICCKHPMQRIISTTTKGLHYKCAVIPFQWHKHEEKECKVERLLNHVHVYEITVFMQLCELFKMCALGHVRRSTVPSGQQAGITTN